MRSAALILSVLLMVACGRSPYPEFRQIDQNIQMKLLRLGDGERVPADGDVLQLWLGISKKYEAPAVLYYDNYEYVFNGETRSKGLETCLLNMQEGDSAQFIMRLKDLELDHLITDSLNVPDSTSISVEIELLKMRTQEEHEVDRLVFQKWLNDKDLRERKELIGYIKAQGMDPEEHYVSGIYYLEDITGEGRIVQSGDMLSIKYRGRFLDSTIFDSSYRSQQPLVFRLGDPDQVVAGMEIGIRQMRQGGKATFIIPSQLGFGHLGSSTGIIPPFTTIIYEVELVEILGAASPPNEP